QLEVERPQRLVQQEHLRLVDHRAGQSHALALAAGKLVWTPALESLQPDHLQGAGNPLSALRPRHSLDAKAVTDVVTDGHVGEEGVILEDRVGRSRVRRKRSDVATRQLDATGVCALEAGDEPKQRRLA